MTIEVAEIEILVETDSVPSDVEPIEDGDIENDSAQSG